MGSRGRGATYSPEEVERWRRFIENWNEKDKSGEPFSIQFGLRPSEAARYAQRKYGIELPKLIPYRARKKRHG